MVVSSGANSSGGQPLLKLVAEELRLPLLQISRRAELAELREEFIDRDFKQMRHGADAALELIDSYILGLSLAENQQILELEPVTVSSVLYDTAHDLAGVAKDYQTDLRLDVDSSCGPVMASSAGLRAALFSLGYTAISLQTDDRAESENILYLSAHRSGSVINAGVYGAGVGHITSAQLRQTLYELSNVGAAGIFVANSILEAMSARLKTSRHHKLGGIAAALQPSVQLQMV